MAFQLITLDEIKKISKGGDSWTFEFEYLIEKIIIPAVTTTFAKYCHRPDWDKVARTEYFSVDICRPARNLFLSSPPISPAVAAIIGPPAVAGIEALRLYQDSADPPTYGAGTELTSGFVVYEDEGVVEHRGIGFVGGPKSIKVTYTGGYLTADGVGTPDEVRLGAAIQGKSVFDRREEFGLTGRSLEGGSVSLLTPMILPRAVTMLLDDYRVYRGC
jgi:hypothetical protein